MWCSTSTEQDIVQMWLWSDGGSWFDFNSHFFTISPCVRMSKGVIVWSQWQDNPWNCQYKMIVTFCTPLPIRSTVFSRQFQWIWSLHKVAIRDDYCIRWHNGLAGGLAQEQLSRFQYVQMYIHDRFLPLKPFIATQSGISPKCGIYLLLYSPTNWERWLYSYNILYNIQFLVVPYHIAKMLP